MAAELEKLTLEQVRDVAHRYFHDRPAITAVVHPELAAAPAGLTEILS